MWARLTCTAPGAAALDLAQVKASLGIDSTDHDVALAAYMAAAQALIEGSRGIGVALKVSTWRLSLDAFPAEICLELGPVTSIVSITYTDAAGANQTLAGTEYLVDLDARPARIVPAWGKAWPTTRDQLGAVKINFMAGGATVPADLVQAMTLLVGHWLANREATAEAGLAPIPFGVSALLDPHRQLAL